NDSVSSRPASSRSTKVCLPRLANFNCTCTPHLTDMATTITTASGNSNFELDEEEVQDNVFDANYRAGWGSGLGSSISSTVAYRYAVESFIRLNDIHSVLDLGCGDWQFSKLIPWDYYDNSYLGLDLSRVIVEKNVETFGTERRQFRVIREPSE